MTVDYNITIYEEFELEVNVTSFTPERHAPVCSNPDSPHFGDSGDDEEIEYEAFFVYTSRRFDLEEGEYKNVKIKIAVPDELYEVIDESVREQCREKFLADRDAEEYYKYEG